MCVSSIKFMLYFTLLSEFLDSASLLSLILFLCPLCNLQNYCKIVKQP